MQREQLTPTEAHTNERFGGSYENGYKVSYPEWRVKTNPEVIGQPRRADGISDQGTPVARLVSIPEISHSFQTDLRQYIQVRSPQSNSSPCRCHFLNPLVPVWGRSSDVSDCCGTLYKTASRSILPSGFRGSRPHTSSTLANRVVILWS